jgi:hypothetical protein
METKLRDEDQAARDTQTRAHKRTHERSAKGERERIRTRRKRSVGTKERERRREKEPQERNKERVLLVILTISFVFFDVCTECREDEGLWCFFKANALEKFWSQNEALERNFWAAVFSLFVLCSCAHAYHQLLVNFKN